MHRILIVDDDPATREVLRSYLRHERFEVAEAATGDGALDLAAGSELVILDLMLPGTDGWRVADVLRQERPSLPILMLSARGGEEDRVRGLEIGADDYVVKPFSPREVVARVKAQLRRSGASDELRHGGLVIRSASREVHRDGQPVPLTRLEFDLLLVLARHPGMVWHRERLLEKVWGPDFPGVTRVVDVRIAALRRKLGDEAERPTFIETVHGVGYRFKEA